MRTPDPYRAIENRSTGAKEVGAIMNYGISTSYFSKNFSFDRLEVFKRAAKCGFEYVQLPITDEYYDYADAEWEGIRNAADEAGVGLFFGMALSAKNDVSSENEQTRQEGIKFVKKVLRGVKRTSATGVGGINYVAWGDLRPPVRKVERRKRSVESIREIGRYAEDLGLIYGLEIANRNEEFLLNTAEEAREFCEDVGCKAVRIVLDTYHMNIEEDDIPSAIRVAGDLLYNVHICENNRKMPIGRNHVIDWIGVGAALRSIGFDGMLTFEPFADPYGDRAIGSKIWRELADDLSEAALDHDASRGLAFIRQIMRGEGACKEF